MDAQFWLQRWNEGRIGFHRDNVMPLLEKHWPALQVEQQTRVLVPLAGKSLDMLWLAARGHHVLGVELSPLAVQQFFEDNNMRPLASAQGHRFVAGNLEIIQGDLFDVGASTLAECNAIYDRAALIALPPPLRQRYVDEVYAKLPVGCRGLLITLEYPPQEMDGPPFPVDADEVQRLFAPHWDIELLERRDILESQPGFAAKGVTALATAVYSLQRR